MRRSSRRLCSTSQVLRQSNRARASDAGARRLCASGKGTRGETDTDRGPRPLRPCKAYRIESGLIPATAWALPPELIRMRRNRRRILGFPHVADNAVLLRLSIQEGHLAESAGCTIGTGEMGRSCYVIGLWVRCQIRM